MGKYTEKDAAKETGDTVKEVNRAWHDARDDAAKEGGQGVPAERHSKDSDRSGREKPSGKFWG